ncbi:MAG: DNA repair protein RecN [Chitinophagales bacterium]|nr:DNA repair protein RecN [Chitinophagales bacterium]
MLQKLTINNYAIIDHLVVAPAAGLNIVTGETGAGKSIILGALSLILGERADTSVLINKDEKCIVEALFDVKGNETFRAAIEEEELDYDEQCIIRREINTSGKSRAFVNDTPVRLDVLNRLTSLLVDLHQQFDHLALDNSHFQMNVLDAVAGNNTLRKDYSACYTEYRNITKILDALKTRKAEWQKEADYKKFLLDELQEAALKNDEIEEAEQHLKQLTHAERITQVLLETLTVLNEGEHPLVNELKRLLQQLDTISTLMPEAKAVIERLNSVHIELKDIADEVENIAGTVTIDEEEIQRLQDRVDIGYKLLKKHNVQTTNELLDIVADLVKDLQASLDIEDAIGDTETQLQQLSEKLMGIAGKLSAARGKHAKLFSVEVNKLLALVGMPNALFSVQVDKKDMPGELGIDHVQFYLDANKSGSLQPVHKAASGGEMSRIMLCIKSLTAKAMELPTLIFDEVDTGVSGEAAKQVGILLHGLARYHQVICITHQPQVAAKADHHMYVYKEAERTGRITTRVSVLTKDERILAIAKMIGGEEPGKAALQNAKELVTA